ncbi:MAG: hypothetical protein A3F14_02830 [Gammaproteobacteria bacterium RIFCSPHIGHO2_12_FULL_43_28]|nr:MAG: hypothetical protein A3F14_02830 [Gammaproteobacteria bacterium RIFCSPHIGHO2_12_FULL_43_28]
MAFRSIKPSRRRHENLDTKVRIIFRTKGEESRIRIYLGMEIARKFGLYKGTRAVLLADPDDLLLQVKKDDGGYKIGQLGKQLCIQAPWPYKNKNVAEGLRFVNPNIKDGNLEVNLPKGSYEDDEPDMSV